MVVTSEALGAWRTGLAWYRPKCLRGGSGVRVPPQGGSDFVLTFLAISVLSVAATRCR